MAKITIISNNKTLPGFKEEHGFSLLLEEGGVVTLFDTGAGDEFIYNFNKLNIDVNLIDNLILSHGHYDHCGNINYILNKNSSIKVLYNPTALKERYSIHLDREPKVKYIGISEDNSESLLNSKPNKLFKNFTGSIPRLSFEDTGGPFYFDTQGDVIDNIEDDASIWFKTENGLFIITGCCHAGIINTVEYIKKKSGVDNVFAILGGLHLLHANEERVVKTIEYINSLKINTLYPGHCTGENVTKRLKETLNCSVKELLAGQVIVI